jgi:predicted NUDIX family phosphoesterase
MSKHQEHILAIDSASIHSQIPGYGENFIGVVPVEFLTKHAILAQRAGLELDPSKRQIITYAVVRSGNLYGAYRRTPKGNESRLHGNASIGFGGHVDTPDLIHTDGVLDLEAIIKLTTSREIAEELDLNGAVITNVTILDEKIVSNMLEVDEVHVGVVAIVDIDHPIAKAGENQLDFLGFKTLEELSQLENQENWTKVLIEFLKSSNYQVE